MSLTRTDGAFLSAPRCLQDGVGPFLSDFQLNGDRNRKLHQIDVMRCSVLLCVFICQEEIISFLQVPKRTHTHTKA